ncbi:PREDICTED: ATP synthase subunit s, mitochondrial isoform X3 [Papilio polytes]|uniref:ATP synthase subunit s, mitochondrial isoform X3 n=1 Tax=Papilio polytes TaxID=76194 RepID=UPI000676735D|nr:PREDICTED: ATP synthase subunit s, mitochondrial isoform X3 [Papilio polytes]
MMQRCSLGSLTRIVFLPQKCHTRSFWEYVNMMFNKPDMHRIKTVGPDRACAEWVLKNGGKVTWADGKKQSDYNLLPPDEIKTPKLLEIDGTDSSISHYGFSHLEGCTMLKKIVLHNNKYIDDRALKGLSYAKDVLTFVQVSKCINVTDPGLKEMIVLRNLKTLVLYDLASVENLADCKQFLGSGLPNCQITGETENVTI